MVVALAGEDWPDREAAAFLDVMPMVCVASQGRGPPALENLRLMGPIFSPSPVAQLLVVGRPAAREALAAPKETVSGRAPRVDKSENIFRERPSANAILTPGTPGIARREGDRAPAAVALQHRVPVAEEEAAALEEPLPFEAAREASRLRPVEG